MRGTAISTADNQTKRQKNTSIRNIAFWHSEAQIFAHSENKWDFLSTVDTRPLPPLWDSVHITLLSLRMCQKIEQYTPHAFKWWGIWGCFFLKRTGSLPKDIVYPDQKSPVLCLLSKALILKICWKNCGKNAWNHWDRDLFWDLVLTETERHNFVTWIWDVVRQQISLIARLNRFIPQKWKASIGSGRRTETINRIHIADLRLLNMLTGASRAQHVFTDYWIGLFAVLTNEHITNFFLHFWILKKNPNRFILFFLTGLADDHGYTRSYFHKKFQKCLYESGACVLRLNSLVRFFGNWQRPNQMFAHKVQLLRSSPFHRGVWWGRVTSMAMTLMSGKSNKWRATSIGDNTHGGQHPDE